MICTSCSSLRSRGVILLSARCSPAGGDGWFCPSLPSPRQAQSWVCAGTEVWLLLAQPRPGLFTKTEALGLQEDAGGGSAARAHVGSRRLFTKSCSLPCVSVSSAWILWELKPQRKQGLSPAVPWSSPSPLLCLNGLRFVLTASAQPCL